MSEPEVDRAGYFFVDLLMENGEDGYYPGNLDTLGSFKVGDDVTYSSTKLFAGKNKFNGLIKKQNKMADKQKVATSAVVTLIASATVTKEGKGNVWFKELTTTDGITAIYFSKEISEVDSIIVGSLVTYSDVASKDGKDYFIGMTKLKRYGTEEKRSLSINRQSAIERAIRVLTIASPKGRWILKDNTVDTKAAAEEVIALAELLIPYISVE